MGGCEIEARHTSDRPDGPFRRPYLCRYFPSNGRTPRRLDARDVLHPGERHALLAPEFLDDGLRRLRAVGDVQRTVHTESVGQAVKPWPGMSQGLSVAGDQLL